MKMLFAVGLVVLILGIAAFFVPFPHHESHGISVGDAKIGVQTEHNQKLSPAVGAVLVVAGGVLMIAGRGRS
jgi:hypothetical protein